MALNAALWFTSFAVSNQKQPWSCSTSQPDMPQMRRLSGLPSLRLRLVRPSTVVELHPRISPSEAPKRVPREGRWGKSTVRVVLPQWRTTAMIGMRLRTLMRSLWQHLNAISRATLDHPKATLRRFLKPLVLTTHTPSSTNSGTVP
jgi:hypothetical protein